MASCSRAGSTVADGSRRPSALSIRACTPPIQAWKSVSAIFIGCCSRQRLEDLAFEDLHLLLRGLQLLLAELRQLQPALVARERLLERQVARLHACHDFLQLGQRFLEGELV